MEYSKNNEGKINFQQIFSKRSKVNRQRKPPGWNLTLNSGSGAFQNRFQSGMPSNNPNMGNQQSNFNPNFQQRFPPNMKNQNPQRRRNPRNKGKFEKCG